MKKIVSIMLLLSLGTVHAHRFSIGQKAACAVVPAVIAAWGAYNYGDASVAQRKFNQDEVIIRPLDTSNKEQIAQVIAICAQHQRMLLMPDYSPKRTIEEHIWFMRQMAKSKTIKVDLDTVALVENPEKIIGFVAFGQEKNRPAHQMQRYLVLNNIRSNMHIGQLAFDEDYQGRGLGTLVMKKLLHDGEKAGLDAATLTVYNENQSMLSLIKRFGFSPVYYDMLPTPPFADGTTSLSTTYVRRLK